MSTKRKQQSMEERALRRLIKRHTERRNWFMVGLLFWDLGTLWEEEEGSE